MFFRTRMGPTEAATAGGDPVTAPGAGPGTGTDEPFAQRGTEWYQQPLGTGPDTVDPAATPARPRLTPAQAFDALYAYCAPALVQQTYLLTGQRRLAREAVERAFQLAWHRWPEVAVDRDPAGWVRAAAHDYALSPWRRVHPRPFPRREPPPADPTGRALLTALLELPPPYRRTLLLYDGVGLDLPDTAAETEASTPAAAGRLLYARAAVTARLPQPVAPDDLNRLLAALPADVRPGPTKPLALRARADLRARRWIHAAIAFTTLLLTTTALTLHTAPDHYEPPVPPGAPVQGIPPRAAPGPLSKTEQKLRAKLRSEATAGPERLHPEAH
ncbi:RNA polymerase subunit sigma-70 [Streptomyces caniscabiei]|uniref:RNA polymerase subunit sigma-70 n=2 Tax=Streptomyces caniscabiei TaxID=2746961 RepID=A0ABU4MJM1_9ACTN|nr:RNA polymerase subunit sigma-70 [Streptomyces caniscabiei]MBE4757632.1 RNA polymerase subunit sigma-70 [Streptomyces caniscabiei]MBE4770976.1 RNA polymerase subunit sigma-70 [Streptomyces caniscabiei]MBE4786751.1 RNA polymerase subunit sigma-70 [Streptomyces caniscabiei]MBE4794995.1 RNA polymerase subunit sigma-70 [Streptomyces caniscabiei]